MKNKHIGNNFDDYLKEEGLLEDAQATAIKRLIAYQVKEIMRKKGLTKKELTDRMQTKSRTHLDRILDPDNVSVTLLTLDKLAGALGKKLKVQFI